MDEYLTTVTVKKKVIPKKDRAATPDARCRKVHKVLHCKCSSSDNIRHRGVTWDRDVNASRNLLALTIDQMFGRPRNAAFCRKTKVST